MANQRRFDPYDLESADELGILGDGSRSTLKLDNQIVSNQISSSGSASVHDSLNDRKSIMNGLFACRFTPWENWFHWL